MFSILKHTIPDCKNGSDGMRRNQGMNVALITMCIFFVTHKKQFAPKSHTFKERLDKKEIRTGWSGKGGLAILICDLR